MDTFKAIKRKFMMIIAGLLLLFIINLFYLTGLYNAIADETDKIVLLAIEEADNEELQLRINDISRLSDDDHTISISQLIYLKTDSADAEIDIHANPEPGESAAAKTRENDAAETGENAATVRLIINRLMKVLTLKVHQSINTILPVNLHLLDSLIATNFKNKGITAPLYYSEIVDLKDETVLASARNAAIPEKTNFYLYEYDTENRYAYKIYTASMTGSVLKRMSGMLATTLLTIVLLGYAFWYFIRTVFGQKTLEEMKTDFTNNMTHELNIPISVAYSAVDTLLNFRQGESREKRTQYLNICLEQLTRLRDMVEQILSMSMNRSNEIVLNMEPIVLKPLFVQIAGQQKMKAEKDVDIEILVQPENQVVYADKTHFNNVINNLIDNAIKYSSEHVIIHLRSFTDKNFCVISIKDDGMGIQKENQKRIFDRFYRVPHGNLHNVRGYGLGLFYVKTIVERHNWEIAVKSALHKGTEFMIKIPVR